MTREREPDMDLRLSEQMGIKPAFVADEGPPVDRQLLQQYRRGELGPEEKKLVEEYVASFRNWFTVFFNEVDEQQHG